MFFKHRHRHTQTYRHTQTHTRTHTHTHTHTHIYIYICSHHDSLHHVQYSLRIIKTEDTSYLEIFIENFIPNVTDAIIQKCQWFY